MLEFFRDEYFLDSPFRKAAGSNGKLQAAKASPFLHACGTPEYTRSSGVKARAMPGTDEPTPYFRRFGFQRDHRNIPKRLFVVLP